jgi:hypothetical protein
LTSMLPSWFGWNMSAVIAPLQAMKVKEPSFLAAAVSSDRSNSGRWNLGFLKH